MQPFLLYSKSAAQHTAQTRSNKLLVPAAKGSSKVNFKNWRILSSIAAVIYLTGCGDSTPAADTEPAVQAAAGSAATATDSPELTAVDFFEAILIDNDIKEAKRHAMPSLRRVLDGYASGKAVGRTLLNMSFDKVEITIEDTNKNVREFYTDKADVMLIFTGMKDDAKVVNMRMVKMEKHGGKWQVAVIKDDPFARTDI
jgi:hypothetical protein